MKVDRDRRPVCANDTDHVWSTVGQYDVRADDSMRTNRREGCTACGVMRERAVAFYDGPGLGVNAEARNSAEATRMRAATVVFWKDHTIPTVD